MKVATYRADSAVRVGVVTERGLVDATGWVPGSVREMLAADRIAELRPLEDAAPDHRFEDVEWLPPVLDPARIVCVGVNYDEHRRETGRAESDHPTLFVRWPSSLVGHQQPLIRPRVSVRFDYEGELAVVIGRGGRAISEEEALQHVAGYACFMDGSVRDFQRHTSQFTAGKNFDASGGFGPWMVTADEVEDPSRLSLVTRLDGEVLQEAQTADLIFDIPRLIAYISTFTTLFPGDVIATGTPAGVGDKRDPPRYLEPGQRLEVEIERIGVLVHGIADEPGR